MMGGGKMPVVEKRFFPRFAVNVPCFVKLAQASPTATVFVFPGETRDISRKGLCFVTAAELEVGTEIDCVIHLPVEPLPQKPVQVQCHGTIVRVVALKQGSFEVGVSVEQFSYPQPAENPAQLASSGNRLTEVLA